MRAILTILCLAFCGCKTVGRIKTDLVDLVAVKDAGKPAQLDESKGVATLPIPAGSRLVVTKFEPVLAVPATDSSPAVAPQPAREVTEVVLSRDTEWKRDETRIAADTGVVDTSIAKRRIDAAENRILLYLSIGCAVLAGVFVYLKYPTPAMMAGAASVVSFMAWKLAGLPDWFHLIAFCLMAGGVALWFGHRRGERDGVKAAITGNVKPVIEPAD